MRNSLIFILTLISLFASAQINYQKNYFVNGVLKSEGWIKNNQKNGYWKFFYKNGNTKKEGHFSTNKPIKYWYFYAENGIKKSEGHFVKGEKTNWWLFYDDMGKINHKCQLKHNQKMGIA